MIVWVNGTFGAGKTSTANALAARDQTLRLFDPEWVGYMLRANLADVHQGDFQDLAPWRALVPPVARQVADLTGQRLIAVQTVLVEQYWRELRAGLADQGFDVFHVVLDADESTLAARIRADEVERQAEQWRLDHLATYRERRDWMHAAADLVVDTTSVSASEVASQVLAAL